MADVVRFNLAEMENLHAEASKHEAAFREGIREMDKIVEELSSMWTSNETGTYETFRQLFKEKLPALDEGDNYMKAFCDKVEQKKNDFQNAANRTNSSFN